VQVGSGGTRGRRKKKASSILRKIESSLWAGAKGRLRKSIENFLSAIGPKPGASPCLPLKILVEV